MYLRAYIYISLRMATYINIAYQFHHLWDVRSWILALSPASKIWSIRLKTSGCAFSTSSKSTKPWRSKVQATKSCATKSTNNLWLWYSIDIHWQWMTNTCRSIQQLYTIIVFILLGSGSLWHIAAMPAMPCKSSIAKHPKTPRPCSWDFLGMSPMRQRSCRAFCGCHPSTGSPRHSRRSREGFQSAWTRCVAPWTRTYPIGSWLPETWQTWQTWQLKETPIGTLTRWALLEKPGLFHFVSLHLYRRQVANCIK